METTAVQSNNKRMPCSMQAYTDKFSCPQVQQNVKLVTVQSTVKK